MPRLTKCWNIVERCDTLEETNDFISTKNVHKRSSKAQKGGSKVEYECSHKKRFDCKFEMYTFVAAREGAQYEIYEYESHICDAAEYRHGLKRAAREMVDLAIEVRQGTSVTSGLARELIKAKDLQIPDLSILPTDRQLYNAVAFKRQKIEGPPILTTGDFLIEMRELFPEGDENTPADTVICAVLECEPRKS
jgi:hypothetical protein